MLEWVEKKALELLSAIFQKLAGLAGQIADGYCHLVNINTIYCDPTIFKWHIISVIGIALTLAACGAGWNRFILVFAALLVASGLGASQLSWARSSEGAIELWLITPLQFAAGLCLGVLICFLWSTLGPTLVDAIKAKLTKSP
jgi:hypothetical protein